MTADSFGRKESPQTTPLQDDGESALWLSSSESCAMEAQFSSAGKLKGRVGYSGDTEIQWYNAMSESIELGGGSGTQWYRVGRGSGQLCELSRLVAE